MPEDVTFVEPEFEGAGFQVDEDDIDEEWEDDDEYYDYEDEEDE